MKKFACAAALVAAAIGLLIWADESLKEPAICDKE